MYQFLIMDKKNNDLYMDKLFNILYSNMSIITPSEDYTNWTGIIKQNINNPDRNIVLIYDNELLIGFFMYSIKNKEVWNMEEIQIAKEYQCRNNIFRELYGFLINIMPDEIITVTACAHKLNKKSQSILKHMGMRFIEEEKGKFYCYKGEYKELLNWYYKAK